MAFSSSKLVLNVVSRALNQGRQYSVLHGSSKYLLQSPHECQTSRTFSRSMWNLCSGSRRNCTGNRGDGTPGPLANGVTASATRVQWPSKQCSCGCGGACLHTKADGELVNFLKEEISAEEESLTKVPNIPGFDTTIDGAGVTLTRQLEGERVSVKFSVNHSVEMVDSQHDQEQDDAAPEMRSYPDFSVEVSKDGSNNLRISCTYHRDDIRDEQDEEEGDDELFLIDELLFARDEAPADALEATYRVGSEVMNGELYDHMKNYLGDRGIDNEFCEKLSDMASAVEHQQYIGFLEKLQTFVKH